MAVLFSDIVYVDLCYHCLCKNKCTKFQKYKPDIVIKDKSTNRTHFLT